MRLLALFALAVLATGCPHTRGPQSSGSVAAAADIDGIDRLHDEFSDDELMELLRELGHDPRPVLEGSITFELGPAQVMLFNQWGGDLQLYYVVTGGDWPLERINEWNRTRRLCRAYLDPDGDLVLESDLLSLGGLTDRQVVSFVAIFEKAVDMFVREVASEGVERPHLPPPPTEGGTWH